MYLISYSQFVFTALVKIVNQNVGTGSGIGWTLLAAGKEVGEERSAELMFMKF